MRRALVRLGLIVAMLALMGFVFGLMQFVQRAVPGAVPFLAVGLFVLVLLHLWRESGKVVG